MPECFLDLSPDDRKEILSTQADRLGRTSFVLEKDVWVCWVLERLFQMPKRLEMAFKGGTSLSKVYQVIDRFSEDVDITLDYRDLQVHFENKGFADSFDPLLPGVSRSQRDKFMDALKEGLREHVHGVVCPYFREEMAKAFRLGVDSVEVDETGEKVWIHYPSVIDDHDYLRKSVLIEFGGRNLTEPNENRRVVPYLAEGISELEFPIALATVLSPSRTFWEKATLIHAECGRETMERSVDRLSRHWYDLALLAGHPIGAKAMGADLGLLEKVVAHKRVFFAAKHANYESCLQGRIRLIPKGPLLEGLRGDYRGMQDMIHGEPLGFEEIIGRLRALETQINGLMPSNIVPPP